MAKKNYAAICSSIIAVCGGEDNISSVSHCMTRLRVQLFDGNKLNREKAGKIPGVLNLVIQNGEYQFVIGQDVPNLYAEFIKREGIKTSGEVADAAALKQDTEAEKGNVMNTVMSFIGGTFSPVIPVLIAGGLTGAVLTLLTTLFGVSTESGTYTVIYAINQATFYFLPIFIGFSAASRLKSNGFLGAFLGAILLFSTINNVEGLNFLGIPIQQISYNSTVFPVILGVLFMAVIYRFLSGIVVSLIFSFQTFHFINHLLSIILKVLHYRIFIICSTAHMKQFFHYIPDSFFIPVIYSDTNFHQKFVHILLFRDNINQFFLRFIQQSH